MIYNIIFIWIWIFHKLPCYKTMNMSPMMLIIYTQINTTITFGCNC